MEMKIIRFNLRKLKSITKVPLNQEGKEVINYNVNGYVNINLNLIKEGYDNDIHIDFVPETIKPENGHYSYTNDFSLINNLPIIYIYASGQQFEGNVSFVFNKDTTVTSDGRKLESIRIDYNSWEGIASALINGFTVTLSFSNVTVDSQHFLGIALIYEGEEDNTLSSNNIFFTN